MKTGIWKEWTNYGGLKANSLIFSFGFEG